MKYRIEVNGSEFLMDLSAHSSSVQETMPGVYSVLLQNRSFQVNVVLSADGVEAWVGLNRYFIKIADPRDNVASARKADNAGRVEVRAQMPGKVIKLLTEVGSKVAAGQGLIVVEAMKMQNEVKSPKDGVITRIHVVEGGTVGAGEPLIVVE